jgi:site-specific DNA-methyltransferase (adenine-specific)
MTVLDIFTACAEHGRKGCGLEHPPSTNGHALVLADPEPRWRITPLGLEAPDDLTYEELYHLGFALGRMERGIAWAIGDWWRELDRAQFTLGDRANELQHATGLDYQTLRNYGWVASKFPLSRRRDNLAFAHHAEVAKLTAAEQDRWLDLAEREGLSRNRLRRMLMEADSRGLSLPLPRHEAGDEPAPDLVCTEGYDETAIEAVEDDEAAGVGAILAEHGITIERADAAHLPLPDGTVDLWVASPPYGLGKQYDASDDVWAEAAYFDQAHAWLEEMHRVGSANARLCLNVPLDTSFGGRNTSMVRLWTGAADMAGWTYKHLIVWNEGNVSHQAARGTVFSPAAPTVIAPCEAILVFHKGEWNLRRKAEHDLTADEFLAWTSGLWTFGGAHRPDHPAPFPEELPRRCITLYAFKDAVVADPFLGSGSSAVAAAKLGRRFFGFDLSETYVKTARRRVAHAMEGQDARRSL